MEIIILCVICFVISLITRWGSNTFGTGAGDPHGIQLYGLRPDGACDTDRNDDRCGAGGNPAGHPTAYNSDWYRHLSVPDFQQTHTQIAGLGSLS